MLLSAGRIPSVLDALNSGPLSGMSLLQEQANMLRFYPNRDVSARALDMFGDSNTYRAEAMDRYRPSLSLRGAPERGRRIFQDRCAACHQIGGEGQRVGPDLTGVVTQGKEAVASAILEPNSRIRPGYETWFVQTRGLENHVGVVERPFPSALVLRRRDGVPLTFPVDALEYFEPQPWSLMPDGLEEGLSGQDFADLLDFLMVHPQGGPRPSAAVLGAVRAAATPARATP
jgi:putative heme-binding domain-containing protein